MQFWWGRGGNIRPTRPVSYIDCHIIYTVYEYKNISTLWKIYNKPLGKYLRDRLIYTFLF